MAETIFVGTQIRLQVDYTSNSEVTPNAAPTVTITNSSNVTTTLGTAILKSVGIYYYDWIASAIGNFTIHFTSTFATSGTVITNIPVEVVAAATAVANTLGEDHISYFLYTVDPMFVDTEELSLLFSDADPIEIAELIYLYSQEAISIAGVAVPDLKMREYVTASVACALSRIYDFAGGADTSELSLGDLSIKKTNSIKAKVTRANATTWCELAAVIRAELQALNSKNGIKAIVKGDKVILPMPDRQIQHQEWRLR